MDPNASRLFPQTPPRPSDIEPNVGEAPLPYLTDPVDAPDGTERCGVMRDLIEGDQLFCYRLDGHEGPHYDRTDRILWNDDREVYA